MGKFNQMTVVATQTQELATFMPSNPVLNGQPTTVVWRNQQGVGKIVAAGSVDGNIKIRLDTGAEFTCKADVFGGVFPEAFINALREAHANQVEIVVCTAVTPNKISLRGGAVFSPNFFCGIKPAGASALNGFNL